MRINNNYELLFDSICSFRADVKNMRQNVKIGLKNYKTWAIKY